MSVIRGRDQLGGGRRRKGDGVKDAVHRRYGSLYVKESLVRPGGGPVEHQPHILTHHRHEAGVTLFMHKGVAPDIIHGTGKRPSRWSSGSFLSGTGDP